MAYFEPASSMHDSIVFNARDWSLDRTDAWIYGIVVGWDQESLNELAAKHRWSPAMVTRLTILHENFVAANTPPGVHAG